MQNISNSLAYSDGTIRKIFRVDNGTMTGVDIIEYYTPEKSIAIPEGNCPAGNGCPPQRYYFDSELHAWMVQYPKGNFADVVPGGSKPADISLNTMGGLHIIPTWVRFGYQAIVPLSAHNFLLVNNLGFGAITRDPLIRTILAIDPSVATPVSIVEQNTIIQQEKDAYTAQ